MIEYNNLNQGNELVITTHSPYLINYLTLSIKANEIYNNLINSNTQEKHDLIKEEINSIVSLKSLVNKNDFAIYQLSDEGDIRLLETLNGLPSDENYLNQNLAELNYLFTDLLEIEDKWK